MNSNNKNIPLIDLNRVHQHLFEEFKNSIDTVIKNNSFVLGPDVEKFENEFSGFCGASKGVSVNSGTDALHLALSAAGVGPGDEVITVPFTFVATLEAIEMCGAQVKLIDVFEEDLTIDINQLEKAITDRTKAIIPVHIYGQVARMQQLKEITAKKGLFLLEDACQAHGAGEFGIKAGALGDAAAFSFYPSKNLGGFGDGGIVTSSSEDIAAKVRYLRNHGQAELGQKGYHHIVSGFCTRMDSMQAAVLSIKLKHLDEWNSQRIKVAQQYNDAFKDLPPTLPVAREGTKHVYYVYAIRSDKRDSIREALSKRGISTGIHYPYAAHLLPAMVHLGYKQGDFPVAEKAANETLSLPIFPGMSQQEVDKVIESVIAVTREV